MFIFVLIFIWILLSATFILFACIFSSQLSRIEELPLSEQRINRLTSATDAELNASAVQTVTTK